MKICIVGAGAIGGLLGVKLALAGEAVTFIARGANLEAIERNGMKLIAHNGAEHVANNVNVTQDMQQAGLQDIVILALKAHQIESVALPMRALYGPDTVVVTTQNGIPWWYFQKHGGEFDARRIAAVDPNGVISENIEVERIIGSIAYPAAKLTAPGVVRHIEGLRFPLGELDGTQSTRAKLLSDLLFRAGFKSPVLTDIRSEIWVKLWGNLTFNPISALTHATLVDICRFPLTRELASMMMTEA
ncbi:MAG: 2-dehydropantoate 2-reductase, partial [Burkholderiales bacterium]